MFSPAFDRRFYRSVKTPAGLAQEVSYALAHFHKLLQFFSSRYIVVLHGEPVVHSYVVDRMLAEFAAAVVVFSKDIAEARGEDGSDKDGDGFSPSKLADNMVIILKGSHPDALPYYFRCLDLHHKDFLWTGPPMQIVPRTLEFISIVGLATGGEMLEYPGEKIYNIDSVVAPSSTSAALPSTPAATPSTPKQQGGKRRGDSLDSADENPKKRRREP